MNPQSTLDAVRELSEKAMLRPSPKRLRVTSLRDQSRGPRRATFAYEELHLPKIGPAGRASGQGARRPRRQSTDENNFMAAALEKTAA